MTLGLASAAGAVEARYPEPNTTRPLAVRTLDGQPLGEGTLTQWMEGDRLHVTLSYRFADGRRVDEVARFRMEPEIAQERWSWRERQGDQLTRQYRIDFETGRATGLKREGDKVHRYAEQLKVEPGRTFAGVGFALAAKNLVPDLRAGQKVELQALAFTPKPRRVQVELSQQGSERIDRDGQSLVADKVVIHPEIGIASLVVKVPDNVLYFVGAEPPQLVAGQGVLQEPGDPVVRTVLLPARRAPAAARRGPAEPGR